MGKEFQKHAAQKWTLILSSVLEMLSLISTRPMQNILENLREGSFLCLKVLTSCLSFSPTTLPLIDSFFNKILKKSKITKKIWNISWGHQEGEKHFLISSVIFIIFHLRATKYCRFLAEMSVGTASCSSLMLFWLKHDMLVSNLYQ